MQDYCRWFIAFWVLVCSVVMALGANYVAGNMLKPVLNKNNDS